MKKTFASRAAQCKNSLAKRLLDLMEQKKTNLALAADVTTGRELIQLAELLGPHLCVFKTHIDLLSDFTPEIPKKLRQIADRHNFLIFEDRKFADIGNTVRQQYEGGIYQISNWAHLTNAHPLPGPGIIEGLQKGGLPRGNGLLLLAQLSSQGSLIDQEYTRKTIDLALKYPDFVIGFICQQKLAEQPFLIHMTPGIQMADKEDALGQQYHTPQDAIYEKGSDIAIVGRGIVQSASPEKAALEYRQAAWSAYQMRIAGC
jgi:uridine monophosphate synthetase